MSEQTPAYVVVDHILKNENEQSTGTHAYNIFFKELDNGDKDAIAEWIKDELSYEDIKKAPALPNEAYTDNSHDNVNSFHKLAFTGLYEDLENKPNIDQEINNLQIAKILDLTKYYISGDSSIQNNELNIKLHNLGNETTIIEGAFDAKSDSFSTVNGQFLTNDIESLVKGFLNIGMGNDENIKIIDYMRPTFLKSNAGLFQILNAERVMSSYGGVAYYKINTALTYDSIYDTEVNEGDPPIFTINESKKISFIFDCSGNILCKVQNLADELSDFNFSIDYDDISNKPNIIQEVQVAVENNSIGLAPVAITGSYDDLTDIVQYPDEVKQITTINYKFHIESVASISDLENIQNPENGEMYYISSIGDTYVYNDITNEWGLYNERLCFKGTINNLPSTNEEIEILNPSIGDIYRIINTNNYYKYEGENNFTTFITPNSNIFSWTVTNTELPAYFNKYAFMDDFDQELNISHFNDSTNNSNELDKLASFGQNDNYIMDLDTFKNAQDNLFLKDAITEIVNNYNVLQKIKIITTSRKYFLTNIQKFVDNNDDIKYVKIEYESELYDNFEQYNGNNFDSSYADTQLQSLTISQIKGYMIFDYINNVIYCKVF